MTKPQAAADSVTSGDAKSPAEPELVDVFLTVGVATSGGPGPGVVRVPRDEANRIIGMKLGVPGTRPPRNYSDGGQSGPVTGTRTFGAKPPSRPAQSNLRRSR